MTQLVQLNVRDGAQLLHDSQHAFLSPYSKYCFFWVLDCLVRWWPHTLFFPRTPLFPVCPFLAFCDSATCSFSRLFSSSSSSPAIKKVDSQSNVKYNTPGSLVKRSSTFSQFPTEKSKTFDFLNEEWVGQSLEDVTISSNKRPSGSNGHCLKKHMCWHLVLPLQAKWCVYVMSVSWSRLCIFTPLVERTSAVHHRVRSRRELSTGRSRPTCRRRTDGWRRTAGACPVNTRWELEVGKGIFLVLDLFFPLSCEGAFELYPKLELGLLK